MKAKQDELSRRRRLNKGQCPTHGTGLEQTGVAHDKHGVPFADVVSCPRKDCDYWTEVRPGTKLWDVLKASGS
jgi:hypothetical protein